MALDEIIVFGFVASPSCRYFGYFQFLVRLLTIYQIAHAVSDFPYVALQPFVCFLIRTAVLVLPKMEQEKHDSGDSSPRADHIETDSGRLEDAGPRDINGPSYVDHRADDDRADVAKGRNADKFDKKYWLSVNYIGTLFAIGMAFMGGIGGERLPSLCANGHV